MSLHSFPLVSQALQTPSFTCNPESWQHPPHQSLQHRPQNKVYIACPVENVPHKHHTSSALHFNCFPCGQKPEQLKRFSLGTATSYTWYRHATPACSPEPGLPQLFPSFLLLVDLCQALLRQPCCTTAAKDWQNSRLQQSRGAQEVQHNTMLGVEDRGSSRRIQPVALCQ